MYIFHDKNSLRESIIKVIADIKKTQHKIYQDLYEIFKFHIFTAMYRGSTVILTSTRIDGHSRLRGNTIRKCTDKTVETDGFGLKRPKMVIGTVKLLTKPRNFRGKFSATNELFGPNINALRTPGPPRTKFIR
jgi:hypothetical protein